MAARNDTSTGAYLGSFIVLYWVAGGLLGDLLRRLRGIAR